MVPNPQVSTGSHRMPKKRSQRNSDLCEALAFFDAETVPDAVKATMEPWEGRDFRSFVGREGLCSEVGMKWLNT